MVTVSMNAFVSIIDIRPHFLGGGLQGLPSPRQLKSQLSLLECPQSLQHVKDALGEAYSLEIEAAQLESEEPFGGSGSYQFYYRINRFNVDSYSKNACIDFNGPWVTAQKLRRDAYIQWAQILKENGIDAAKEGFTSLVSQ